MKRGFTLVAGLLVLTHPIDGQPARPQPREDTSRVVLIANEVWQRLRDENAGLRLREGLPVRRLPTMSADQAAKDSVFGATVLARLDSIGPLEVGTEDWSLAVVLRWRAEADIASGRYYWFQNPVTPYASALPGHDGIFTAYRFRGSTDLDGYLDLLSQYPRLIEEIAGFLRGQVRRGIVMAKPEVAASVQMLRGMRREPGESPLSVDSTRLRTIDPAAARRFRMQVTGEINESVNPAIDRLMAYLSGPYASLAPTTVGLAQYPGGAEYYRHLVKRSLTFEMKPEEVHELGVREVARLNASMDSIRRSVGFQGTKADFHRMLRTDSRFVPQSPEAVRQRMLGFVNALAPKLKQVFAVVPTTPYDVRRLDPALEPGMTFGYYRGPTPAESVGVYFFNGSNLDQKSQVWYEGLAYHELLPGHHFDGLVVRDQLARQHPIRRRFSSAAFGEGWGEYAAGLAGELGAYADPYDRYGRFVMELFTAVRLVLDTGMNLHGWSRERAMDYMREHSVMAEPEIASETLRYCCDIPSQALGYRMGLLKIQALRRKAQSARGPAFSLKDFHQLILSDGPLPFFAVEQRVDAYLARRGKRLP